MYQKKTALEATTLDALEPLRNHLHWINKPATPISSLFWASPPLKLINPCRVTRAAGIGCRTETRNNICTRTGHNWICRIPPFSQKASAAGLELGLYPSSEQSGSPKVHQLLVYSSWLATLPQKKRTVETSYCLAISSLPGSLTRLPFCHLSCLDKLS